MAGIELPDDGVLVSLRSKMIRDPIYGYIILSEMERNLVDLPIVQRLRRLHQLQTAYLVYPGAEHSRFQHSLGVMHLSGKFAVSLIRRTYSFRETRIKDIEIPSLDLLGIEDISDIFSHLLGLRIAGLFHDIGHGPYSHAFDEAIISNNNELRKKGIYSHEDVGWFIYRNHLREYIREDLGILEKNRSIKINTDTVLDTLNYILAPRNEKARLEGRVKPIIKALRHILREFIYPADILDFTVRDSYYTGAKEYGMVDFDRLIQFSVIVSRHGKYELVTPDIGLFDNALNTLRAFLMSRFWLFNNVYFHKFSRIMDFAVKSMLKYAFEEECIDFTGAIMKIVDEGDVSEYLLLDDYSVIHNSLRCKKASKYAKMVLNRISPLKEVFYHEIPIPLQRDKVSDDIPVRESIDQVTDEIKQVIADKLQINKQDVYIDYPLTRFFPDNPYLPPRSLLVLFMRGDKPVYYSNYTVSDATAGLAVDMTVLRIFLISEVARSLIDRIGEVNIRESIQTELDKGGLLGRFTNALLLEYSKKDYGITM